MTTVHVMPMDDLMPHEADDDCCCGPTQMVEPTGFIAVHHALDGRETEESNRE